RCSARRWPRGGRWWWGQTGRTGCGRRLTALRALQDLVVRGKLRRVVELRKGVVAPSPERRADDVIGELRVLRQQGAMQVGADDAVLDRTLGVVGAVVAFALDDLAERFGCWPEECTAAVVLETDESCRFEAEVPERFHDNITDEPLAASLRGDVEQADAVVALAVGCLVVVPEQLVAAADGEDLRSVVCGLT